MCLVHSEIIQRINKIKIPLVLVNEVWFLETRNFVSLMVNRHRKEDKVIVFGI